MAIELVLDASVSLAWFLKESPERAAYAAAVSTVAADGAMCFDLARTLHPGATFTETGRDNEEEALARRAAEVSAEAFLSTCSSHGGDALRALAIVEPDVPEDALQRKAECVKRAVSCIAVYERDLRAVAPRLDRPLPPTIVLYREQGENAIAMNPVIVANFIAKHLLGVGAGPKG